MGIFGKSAQQRRIEADALTIADLTTKLTAATTSLEEAQRKNRELDGLAKQYRDRAAKAGQQVPHLEAENHRLSAELARLTTRGPGGRFVKIGDGGSGFIKPTNGAAAQAVVS